MNPDRRRSRVRIALTSLLTALVLCGSAARAAGQESPTSMPLALCVGCHPPGQSPPAPTFPSLSGQHIEYTVKQLRDYKHGRRLSPVMVPPLATVNARDIDSIALFFNRQPVVPGRPGEAALVERGRTVYHDGVPAAGVANCGGCHEADGTGSGRFPRLAGLDPAYLAQQLTEFRTGVRHNDPARVMRVVAGRMTDDDIRAVAEYIGTLGRDD